MLFLVLRSHRRPDVWSASKRGQLKKHGYPPDKTETAVETVVIQAEQLAADGAGS